ncbi:TetR family transcriptional regulator [Pseudomonas sp. TTU2014-080ASC]|uniref:TetR family transcriptional regulator n=1 Tax=Pseudomonas sp. TTU2014-080ASC TaxID=1729724 RepID=UPI00071868EE|nr:TetR family transcriptional regulator [Pseudomonas sp. TTU2014-080ASC]KRW58483.1 TetR family transcriptional regulator [Pseudomonas sp. TTU2014-080ASC]
MRRTKEDAEKTRITILEAAETLFLEKGVAHTSLEHIARQAGVTRGAVYWHFANKADLFTAMLNQVRLPPEQLVERISGCPEHDPLQTLRQLCVDALSGLVQDEKKQRIFTILLRRCEFTEELRPAEERHEAFINLFIELCEQQFNNPAVRPRLYPGICPRLAARTVHAVLIGMFHDWLRDPTIFNPEIDISPIVDACFRGLVKDWHCCPPNDQAKPAP